jgi:hypothetical protein
MAVAVGIEIERRVGAVMTWMRGAGGFTDAIKMTPNDVQRVLGGVGQHAT